MAVSYWEWLNRSKDLSCCYPCACFEGDYLAQNNVLIKRDSRWREIYEVLAARMRKFITARVRKNKRTARMLANARKDHSIPLMFPLGIYLMDINIAGSERIFYPEVGTVPKTFGVLLF